MYGVIVASPILSVEPKTEKTKGVYDWAWMDRIINDAAKRGKDDKSNG